MATEQAFPSSPVLGVGGAVITSPFQFVADSDTKLRVVSVCSVAGVVIAVQGRRLDAKGQIQPITETHTPLSTRTTLRQDYGVGSGAILNLTVFASQGTPLLGQCYVMVQLLRNVGNTAIVLGTLLGGYITSAQALGFPGSPVRSSFDLEPPLTKVLSGTPPPGIDWSFQPPAGARWKFLRIFAALTTSAAAGNRAAAVEIDSGVNFTAIIYPAAVQAASLTIDYTWAPNLPINAVAGSSIFSQPLPDPSIVANGDALNSFTVGIAPMDQWTSAAAAIQEWLEVQ